MMVYDGSYLWFGVVTIAMIALAIWLSARYWRDRMRMFDDVHQLKMSEMRFGLNTELRQQKERNTELEISRQKERVENNLQTKKALNKVDLVYNILHDVQAVHQGVDSYLRMVMDSELTPPQEEWEMMCREMKRKSNLVRDLVDSAIELLQYENLVELPREDNVLMNEFCQDMFEACKRYLKNNNLDLVFETALPDGFIARTNMSYLRKLMKDLLICSMEYTQEGFIKMVVNDEPQHRLLHFVIRDTGIGIPDDVLENVFEQLPDDEDLHNKIAGIRLRRARVLVHLLGGTVFIDKLYPNGTAIFFTILA